MTENSFDKIKKLIKIIGGKVLIVEDGKPVFVIIDIDEYVNFDKIESAVIHPKKSTEENANRDIGIWKNKQDERKLKQLEIKDDFIAGDDEKNIDDEIIVEKL